MQGETITVSLEDAAQIILQQQGIDGTVHFTPGTYHILTQDGIEVANGIQDSTSSDQIQFDVVHATPEELEGLTTHTILQTDDGTHIIAGTAQDLIEGNEGMLVKSEEHTNTSLDIIQTTDTDPISVSQSQVFTTSPGGQTVMVIQPIAVNADVTDDETLTDGLNAVVVQAQETSVQSPGRIIQLEGQTGQCIDPNTALDLADSNIENLGEDTSLVNGEALQPPVDDTVNPEGDPKSRKPDLSKPIAVTDRTEVVINGKKCILMPNPETGQLCAYPLLPPPGKRRRGRPRKQIIVAEELEQPCDILDLHVGGGGDDVGSQEKVTENTDNTNSAAEGLLELSYTGPDGVRKSSRVRKKAKTLDDYEILEVSSDEEPDDDDEVTPPGFKRRKITPHKEDSIFSPIFLSGMKRGRGRPRRYPLPGQPSQTTHIPAVLIPGVNGNTLMMAPIQGFHNLQAFQEQMKSLQPITVAPNLGETDDTTGTIMEVTTLPIDGNSSGTDITHELTKAAEAAEEAAAEAGKSFAEMSEKEIPDVKFDEDDVEGIDENKPTIIQIPENLLPMFLPKKDPVKIGLKASETELEKLKCQKCNFQAFYPHQYQNHIAAHGTEVQKCKCCNFLTFDKDELMRHFEETHPRCICNVCDFTAEHAYIIKRHMMRHNTSGCTCDICGKVYKDQYILKMHLKMVHMPAEVLFECTVCAKKFTRKAHLKRHLRIHDPEKPFKCPHCDYRGCEKSDISKHLLIHEEPKHVCEVCGKAFRHIKNKELHVKRHNGQKDYKCGVCDFYGYTFTDIRKHIERKHSDIKTLVCDKCGLAFKSEMMLLDHQKQQCEVFMIEQALAIATSTGGTSRAMIQIPSFAVDGQHITIGGQQIAVDSSGQVNITVEQVSLPEDEIELTEDQIEEEEEDDSIGDHGAIESEGVALDELVETEESQIEENIMSAEGELSIAMV